MLIGLLARCRVSGFTGRCAVQLTYWWIFLSLLASAGYARPKLDTISMDNGDRFTCEIVRLEFGQLHVKMPYALGTVVLDWGKVQRIESPQRFVVETTEGEHFTGLLERDASEDDTDQVDVTVVEPGLAVPLYRDSIVEIRQMETEVLRKTKFNFDYGFTFNKSNNQTQSTLQGALRFRTPDWWTGVDFSSIFASQRQTNNTSRHSATVDYNRFLGGRKWFAGAVADFLTNTQQQLDLRTTLGGGLGRRLVYDNRNALVALGGVAWNNETFDSASGSRPTANSAEALLSLDYSTFRFNSSELTTGVSVLPSLTDLGRVRIGFDASLYWKIISDFYIRTSFYDNYDSRPPANTARNDFGVTSSIGWSFN